MTDEQHVISFDEDIEPVCFLMRLYKCCDKDGFAELRDRRDIDDEFCRTYRHFRCRFSWTEEEAEKLLSEYNHLSDSLDLLANMWNEIEENGDGRPVVGQQYLETVYHIYVKPLEGETEEERRLDAQFRVGDGLCAVDVIRHATRLCHLYRLDAPRIIRSAEGRMLIAAMALHAYGVSMEQIGETRK